MLKLLPKTIRKRLKEAGSYLRHNLEYHEWEIQVDKDAHERLVSELQNRCPHENKVGKFSDWNCRDCGKEGV